MEAQAAGGKRLGKYSFDALLEMPERVRAEIYDGELVFLARPTTKHAAVSNRLCSQLTVYLQGKLCQVYPEVTVQLDPEVTNEGFEPDIIVVCDPEKIKEKCCEGAPDLIIEILSPSTKRRDRNYKLRRYLEAGVKEYWIIDPVREYLYVFDWRSGETDIPDAYFGACQVKVNILDDCYIDLERIFHNIPPATALTT
ncbi:hypothetical protein AGMMS49992_06170 [Clostridia bacterium]|nr:hypothetical protein AGMMS49992_06170 [Clostridia bacterium]